MNIGHRTIGSDHPPYIIAEIGVNHDGSSERALELVRFAKQAGADAIKLQMFRAESLLSRAAKLALYQQQTGAADPFELLRSLELHEHHMPAIIDAAHQLGLHAIVTVFSLDFCDIALDMKWDAFKIASPDIVHKPLIESVMRSARPMLVSTGAATLDEVKEATRWLGAYPHILMHCVSSYPTPDDQAALNGRLELLTVNCASLGYSDHTSSIDTGALAVATGACILEKHITYDRDATGPDHRASLDPRQFAEYVALSHRAYRMLGGRRKIVLDIEEDVRHVSRQSVTTTRTLQKGDSVSAQDITIKRPGLGIAPAAFHTVIGRCVKRQVEADMPIMEDDLV